MIFFFGYYKYKYLIINTLKTNQKNINKSFWKMLETIIVSDTGIMLTPAPSFCCTQALVSFVGSIGLLGWETIPYTDDVIPGLQILQG